MSLLFGELIKRDVAYRQSLGQEALVYETTQEYLSLLILERATIEKELTGGAVCPKCGKDTVIVSQIQLRSGDEGSNTLHRCTAKGCSYVRSSQ